MNAEKSRGSRLLGWSPFLLVSVVSAAAWAVFLRGGFPSILGWLALLILLPVLGLVLLAGTVVRSIQKRRGGRRLGATFALAALCLERVWAWYLAPLVPGIVAIYVDVFLRAPHARLRIGAMFLGTLAFFVFLGWLNARAARRLRSRMEILPRTGEPLNER